MRKVLTELHRGVVDFQFYYMEWLDKYKEVSENVKLVFIFITALALLVGGLNIMNVMLASISARMNEIGVRKTVGANSLHIFVQFIIEAVCLSLLGGLIGLALSMAPPLFITGILNQNMEGITLAVKKSYLLVGFCIAVLEGVLFGIYPAIKAWRMNPVTALQYV